MSASSKKKLRKEQNAAAMTEKQLQAQKEAKKLKTYTLTFVVTMILVVVIALGAVVRIPISGAMDRGSHAATVGEHTLSATDLSYYFVDAINEYYSDLYDMYGSYAQYFLGFQTGTPLNEQVYDKTEGTTWSDYFLEKGVENATGIYALYDDAIANNHELTEEEQEALETGLENVELMATYYGYSSTNSYLRANYGDGANLKTYTAYRTINAIASSYYNAHSDSIEYTDEDYRDYEKGKYNTFSSYTYATYTVTVSNYLEGGTEDSSGSLVYSDEENQAAQDAALKDAQTLSGGEFKDLDAFNKAIGKLTINKDNEDAAATEYNNTLYTNISNTDIQKWVGNSARKAGDVTSIAVTKTVENSDGSTTLETTSYQIVYYISCDENKVNLVDVQHILVQFEGGTTDSTTYETVYSDTEKAAAEEKARELLQQWMDGDATKESFAELATEETDDTASATSGGLYEDVYPYQMVDAFNDWCFDAERQPGDTGIVETEYGFHVMYFVGTKDINYRDYMIKYEMLNAEMEEWFDSLKETVAAEVLDTSRVNLDYTFGS